MQEAHAARTVPTWKWAYANHIPSRNSGDVCQVSAKSESEPQPFAFSGGSDDRSSGALEQRLAEAEQSKQQLLVELAQAGNQLAEVNGELRRANLDVEQFAFSASHALREPLRNLALYTELLRRKPNLSLDEEAREYLSIVLENAKRMELLFHDLLAFIEIKHSAGSSGEADTNTVLEEVLADLSDSVHETGAVITAGPLPALCLNAPQLFRLFRNLIDNAIKYTAPGVRPRIQIDSYATGEDSVICIHDNGIGIAAQHQERVFELFKRLHGSDEYQGTGLGLALCQKIVEQHGGRIWVESELGQGAVFCFRLRRAQEQKARAARSA
jgi:light-regulated signal transduction histidine kinase (bacteriophytochrome)